jgi:hypothetical protein
MCSDLILSYMRVIDVEEVLSSKYNLKSLFSLALKFPTFVAESECMHFIYAL